MDPVRHNHITRDVKEPGKCPSCDLYWAAHPKPCPSRFVVDSALTLTCEVTGEHPLANVFIPRLGQRHSARHIGLEWYWDDLEADEVVDLPANT